MPGEVVKVFLTKLTSRAEPIRAEPSRAEPKPSRAEPSRAEPSRAGLSRAGLSRTLPPSLPPLPALSLRVFFTFYDPSHTECLLLGPLSLPPLFSHSLLPSLPPQPAFSLHVFPTFFNTSHTKHLLLDLFHNFPVPNLSTFTS